MKRYDQIISDLIQLGKTKQIHTDMINPIFFTDGIKYLTTKYRIGELISYISDLRKNIFRNEKDVFGFEIWILEVQGNRASLKMYRKKEDPFIIEDIFYQEALPDGEYKFYVDKNVLMLPSERSFMEKILNK